MGVLHTAARRLEPPFKMRYLGFGLVFAWSMVAFETGTVTSAQAGDPHADSLAYLASTFVTPIAFLVLAILCRTRPLSRFTPFFVAAPLMCSLASLLIAFEGSLPGLAGAACTALGALCAGIGPALLIALWMEAIDPLGLDSMEVIIPSSFSMTIIALVAAPMLSSQGAVVFSALLPLVSGACLLLAWFGRDGAEEKGLHKERGQFQKGALFRMTSRNVAAAASAIFVAYFVSCAITANISYEAHDAVAQVVGYAFAILLAFYVVMYSVHVDLDALYRIAVVPFVIALVCAAYTPAHALSICVSSAVMTCLEIIMLLFFTRWSYVLDRPISCGVCIGEFAAYAGVCLGTVAELALRDALAGSLVSAEGIALFLVAIFACSTLLVFRSAGSLEMSPVEVDVQAEASKPEEQAALTCGPDGGEAAVVIEKEFVKVCASIARESKLSARETEIFTLLAQGRSQPYIRDALVLSKNTVSTHVRHIYTKLGVHSKQELLDLVEAH